MQGTRGGEKGERVEDDRGWGRGRGEAGGEVRGAEGGGGEEGRQLDRHRVEAQTKLLVKRSGSLL